MSIEEDTELRDLLAETLESNGSLAKIRAQLRASVFLAFDEDELIQKKEPLQNHKIKSQLGSADGKLMFCIVREFLEYFNLDYTISVYEPESYLGDSYNYEGRNKLVEALKLDANDTVPLLLQLIKIAQDYNVQLNSHNTSEKTNGSSAHINSNGDSKESQSNHQNGEIKEVRKPHKNMEHVLNETYAFNLSNDDKSEEKIETPRSVESVQSRDDTYEGTSSIAEDSVKENSLIDLDKSLKSSSLNLNSDAPSRTLLDASIVDFSQPVLKQEKHKDKLKSKSNLTSLADLPPLQLNKSRNNDLLPSLYTNEFKDKNREMDKLFNSDPMDNYEEDFLSGSECLKSDRSLNELNISEVHKLQGQSRGLNEGFRERNDSIASSIASEDYDLNSNVDDILKSNNSK